jgi:hypothetical protein
VYPYEEFVIHGDTQSVQDVALFKYAETHVTVELVRVSQLVTAA